MDLIPNKKEYKEKTSNLKVYQVKILILGGLAVAIVLLALFFDNESEPKIVLPEGFSIGEVKESPVSTFKTAMVSDSEIINFLPTDFPLEDNVSILSSERYSDPVIDYGKYFVLQYTSNKSLKSNYDLFVRYMSQNEWKIESKELVDIAFFLEAFKEGQKLVIRGNLNKSVTLKIIYFQK